MTKDPETNIVLIRQFDAGSQGILREIGTIRTRVHHTRVRVPRHDGCAMAELGVETVHWCRLGKHCFWLAERFSRYEGDPPAWHEHKHWNLSLSSEWNIDLKAGTVARKPEIKVFRSREIAEKVCLEMRGDPNWILGNGEEGFTVGFKGHKYVRVDGSVQ